MKLNWGSGIAIFYGLFVLVMVGAVIKASQLGVDLVQEKYYDADIAYEEFRQKRENAKALESQPQVQVLNRSETLVLDFKGLWVDVKGTVRLYRPSDKYADLTFPLRLEDKTMSLSTEKLKKGRWKVILDWKGDGEPYYMETDIVL